MPLQFFSATQRPPVAVKRVASAAPARESSRKAAGPSHELWGGGGGVNSESTQAF